MACGYTWSASVKLAFWQLDGRKCVCFIKQYQKLRYSREESIGSSECGVGWIWSESRRQENCPIVTKPSWQRSISTRERI